MNMDGDEDGSVVVKVVRPDPRAFADVVLRGDERMGQDRWPFVVARFGPDWRLSISRDGKAYRLQRRHVGADGGVLWAVVGGRSRFPRLVDRFAGDVPGLYEVGQRLGDDPLSAFPAIALADADLQERFRVSSYGADDYPRVAAQEGNLRLIVDRAGALYQIQWVRVRDYLDESVNLIWSSVRTGATAAELADWLRYDSRFHSYEHDAFGVRDDELHAARVNEFFAGVPATPLEGTWPVLPVAVRLSDGESFGASGVNLLRDEVWTRHPVAD